jgi:ribulose-phosphate 3-epimerase
VRKIKIYPSIIAADYANLGREINNISKAGADAIHFDIMDGNFVPNISIGPDLVKSLRKYSDLPFHAHLMVSQVDYFIEQFAEISDLIIIHVESTIDALRSLKLIKSLGKQCGISLIPSTSEDTIDYLIPIIDQVLVMTVNPGFCGQKFIDNQLTKIYNISKKIALSERKIDLSIDGGINDITAKKSIANGATSLVAGSFIFSKDGDYTNRINQLKSSC